MVSSLGVGKQQLVEIAKALNKKAKLIILDEPTASLTEIEVGILMGILKELKRDGTTCIYISHKLNEVIQIADSVTVLRDGQTIVTKGISEVNEEKLISYMVGSAISTPGTHAQGKDFGNSPVDRYEHKAAWEKVG